MLFKQDYYIFGVLLQKFSGRDGNTSLKTTQSYIPLLLKSEQFLLIHFFFLI